MKKVHMNVGPEKPLFQDAANTLHFQKWRFGVTLSLLRLNVRSENFITNV
jgi:hypothetical protein